MVFLGAIDVDDTGLRIAYLEAVIDPGALFVSSNQVICLAPKLCPELRSRKKEGITINSEALVQAHDDQAVLLTHLM